MFMQGEIPIINSDELGESICDYFIITELACTHCGFEHFVDVEQATSFQIQKHIFCVVSFAPAVVRHFAQAPVILLPRGD